MRRKRIKGGFSLSSLVNKIRSGLHNVDSFLKKYRPAHNILKYAPSAAKLPYGIGDVLTQANEFGYGKRRRVRRK